MFKNQVATFSKNQDTIMDSVFYDLSESAAEYCKLTGSSFESDFELLMRAVIQYKMFLDDRVETIKRDQRKPSY